MVLITGGLGYLGGRFSEYLIKAGEQVRIATRKIPVQVSECLIDCELVELDLFDESSISRAMVGVDTIIHLASMNAQECEVDPESAMLVNVLGTLRLLRAAEKEGINKFIYFSTMHVYGSILEGRYDEKYLPHPSRHYSITHRMAEDYVLEADFRGALSGIVFRLSNAVGAPVSRNVNCWMLVVNNLCKQSVISRFMSVRSVKYEKRDFVPISMVCSVLKSAIQQKYFDGEIINISAGYTTSLYELTKLISSRSNKVLGLEVDVEFGDSSDGSPEKTWCVSNEKLLRSGFIAESDLTNEIDQLLLRCSKWFA